jgi:hypothetical protein
MACAICNDLERDFEFRQTRSWVGGHADVGPSRPLHFTVVSRNLSGRTHTGSVFFRAQKIRGMRPAPEVGAFLRTLRAESRGKRAQSAVIPTIEPASNTFPITCTNELFGGE